MLVIAVIGAFIAAEIYIRTPAFGALLTLHIQPVLERTFRGEVTLRRLDTSVPGALTIYDLAIRLDGKEIARIPILRATYSLIPLLWHQVRIEVVFDRPQVDLERDNNGEWNLSRALTPRASSAGHSAFTIYISRLDVRRGVLQLLPSPNGRRYRLEDVNITSWLSIDASGLEARIARLGATLRARAAPPTVIRGAVSYLDTNGRRRLKIAALNLDTGKSSVALASDLQVSPNLSVDATLTIDRLQAADLEKLVHNYPLREDIKGRATLHGVLNDIHVDAELAAGHARIVTNMIGDLARRTPAWSGHLVLNQLDLDTLALHQKIAGTTNAALDFKGEAAIERIAAEIRLEVQNLQIGRTRVGNLALTGEARSGHARFGGHLVPASGREDFNGEASLAENGRYRLAVTTQRLNLAQMLSSIPPTDFNTRLVIEGTGHRFNTLNATLDFHMNRSMIAHVPLESSLHARVKDRTIELLGGTLSSQGSVLKLAGTAKLDGDKKLRLDYQARVQQLTPWLKLAGADGEGRAAVVGAVSGKLHGREDISLDGRGVLNIQQLRAYDFSLAAAKADYSFKGLSRGGWPSAVVDAHFGPLQSITHRNISLSSVATRLLIERGPLPRIRSRIEIHDNNRRVDSLVTDFVIHPHRITGTLDDAVVTATDGVWRLQHPAAFAKDNESVSLQGLALANGERELRLDALSERNGRQDIALHARSIDLSAFEPLLPRKEHLSGQITTDVVVAGTASAPEIHGSFEASALRINSQSAGNINAGFEYQGPKFSLGLICHQDANHRLELSGEVPLTLRWSRGFTVIIGNDEHLRLQTAGLRLAPYAALASGTVSNAKGMLRADLTLTGFPFRPEMTGDVQVDGSGEIVQTGVTIRSFNMRLKAAPARIEIARLEALAGKGYLRSSGTIALHNGYSPGALDVHIQLKRWPAMATQQYDVSLDGDIEAAGTPAAPRIVGQIDVIDSTIYPDLAFLSNTSAPPPDSTIVVIEAGENHPSASGMRSEGLIGGIPPSRDLGAFRNLSLQLRVDIHRNNWIRHENTQVELAGKLNVQKRPGNSISAAGEIDTIRGWFAFMGKRFSLVNGEIIFTGGPPIDPTLHIDGQYLVSNYTIDVIVGGRASKPEIKLESQPQLAQSDILSLILFGTTSADLGQGQKTTLQQRAQSIATGAVGQTLVQSLGLESMGASVSGQSIGVGHYLGQNTYLSISPNLGANTSNTPSQVASIQYFLARWLSVTTATMSDGSRQIFVDVRKRY